MITIAFKKQNRVEVLLEVTNSRFEFGVGNLRELAQSLSLAENVVVKFNDETKTMARKTMAQLGFVHSTRLSATNSENWKRKSDEM